jgi:protein-L-isoaspartate O-methyltransferase
MAQSMNAAGARRFLAEETRVVHNLRSQRMIDAIATVPRKQFLPPGPSVKSGEVALP